MQCRGWSGRRRRAAHAALYAFLFFLPLTGWALVSASPFNIPTVLYGVIPWPHLPVLSTLADKAPVEHVLKIAHGKGAWLLIALVLGPCRGGATPSFHHPARSASCGGCRRSGDTEKDLTMPACSASACCRRWPSPRWLCNRSPGGGLDPAGRQKPSRLFRHPDRRVLQGQLRQVDRRDRLRSRPSRGRPCQGHDRPRLARRTGDTQRCDTFALPRVRLVRCQAFPPGDVRSDRLHRQGRRRL